MPIYPYRCPACGERVDHIPRLLDGPTRFFCTCGCEMEREAVYGFAIGRGRQSAPGRAEPGPSRGAPARDTFDMSGLTLQGCTTGVKANFGRIVGSNIRITGSDTAVDLEGTAEWDADNYEIK